MAFSDTKLRKIKAPYNEEAELADRDGLSVRVSPKTLITFNYRFRWKGKQQRIKLGRYPRLKLIDARKKVNKYRQNCGLKHKHYINLLFINMSHLIKTLILKDIDWSAYFD